MQNKDRVSLYNRDRIYYYGVLMGWSGRQHVSVPWEIERGVLFAINALQVCVCTYTVAG